MRCLPGFARFSFVVYSLVQGPGQHELSTFANVPFGSRLPLLQCWGIRRSKFRLVDSSDMLKVVRLAETEGFRYKSTTKTSDAARDVSRRIRVQTVRMYSRYNRRRGPFTPTNGVLM